MSFPYPMHLNLEHPSECFSVAAVPQPASSAFASDRLLFSSIIGTNIFRADVISYSHLLSLLILHHCLLLLSFNHSWIWLHVYKMMMMMKVCGPLTDRNDECSKGVASHDSSVVHYVLRCYLPIETISLRNCFFKF